MRVCIGVFLIYHAIVLKNHFPKKNKVTILHEQYGKINLFVSETQESSRLCNGSLIFCDVIKKESSYRSEFIDAYFIPFDQDRYDLYFIHDLLKVCLNFAPWQIMIADVFDLLLEIYGQLDVISVEQKKIYLLKIFLYLGIFPEDKRLYQIVMQNYRLDIQDMDQLLCNALSHCWNSNQALL